MTDSKIDKRWPERNRELTPEMAERFYMLCSGKIIAKKLVHFSEFEVMYRLNREFREYGGICVAKGHVHN